MKKGLFFLVAILGIFIATSFNVHPYHVGSVEINYNSKSKTFEVSGRYFIDDLEDAISNRFHKKMRFLDKGKKAEMNEALKNYATEYIKLRSNNASVKLNYLGFQEDKESVDFFLESDVVTKPIKVETSISMIYNLYDDQMTIVHVVVDGKRKTSRASFPDKYLKFDF